MHAPWGTTQRVSGGGVTVYVIDFVVINNIVRRIFTDMSDSVVLLIDSIFNDRIDDIFLIFTYIVPEKPRFTPQKMMMELKF